jgi:hypothetical protein
MSQHSPYDDLPNTVLAAFAKRTMLTATEVARLLEMDPDTLRYHVRNGEITGRIKGAGKVKPRWVFTIADVARYLRSTQTVRMRDDDRLEYLRALSAQYPSRGSKVKMNIALRKPRRKPKQRLAPDVFDRGNA